MKFKQGFRIFLEKIPKDKKVIKIKSSNENLYQFQLKNSEMDNEFNILNNFKKRFYFSYEIFDKNYRFHKF